MQGNRIHAIRGKVTPRENCTVVITIHTIQFRNFASSDTAMTINVMVEHRQGFNRQKVVTHFTRIYENIVRMWVCPDFIGPVVIGELMLIRSIFLS